MFDFVLAANLGQVVRVLGTGFETRNMHRSLLLWSVRFALLSSCFGHLHSFGQFVSPWTQEGHDKFWNSVFDTALGPYGRPFQVLQNLENIQTVYDWSPTGGNSGTAKEYQKMVVVDCHIIQVQSMTRVVTALAGIGGTCPHRGNIGNQTACRRPQSASASTVKCRVTDSMTYTSGRHTVESLN